MTKNDILDALKSIQLLLDETVSLLDYEEEQDVVSLLEGDVASLLEGEIAVVWTVLDNAQDEIAFAIGELTR